VAQSQSSSSSPDVGLVLRLRVLRLFKLHDAFMALSFLTSELPAWGFRFAVCRTGRSEQGGGTAQHQHITSSLLSFVVVVNLEAHHV